MANTSTVVQRSQLESWLESLNKEFSVKGDGIYVVKQDITSMLKEMDASVMKPQEGLEFRDVKVGNTYKFRDSAGIDTSLHYAPVKVLQKKRTKIIAELLVHTAKYTKGARLDMKPDLLTHI